MSWQNIWQVAKSDHLKLVLIMALAFYLALEPHLNYPYPIHIDEWIHLAYSRAIVQAQDTTFINPFFGQETMSLSSNLEAGFHLFWGVFHQISGISWMNIFRYFPSVIFMFTVLSVYVMARRQGFGWEAALFTSLIPTTIGIMGPAFLVPVAMGLLFIPLSLFIAFNFRTWWSYLVLFSFASFLLFIHAPSAIVIVIIMIPYILLTLKGNFKHSLGLTLALAIPFLGPLPWIFTMLLPTAELLLTPQPLPAYVVLPRLIQDYGYLLVALCLVGVFMLGIRGGKKDYSLILGLLALLVMLVTFYTFHYGLDIMYTRGLMFAMLMMAIVGGAGLMWVRKLKPSALGYTFGLVLIGLTLFMTVPTSDNFSYYHMIDKQDYEAFRWIEDNVGADYGKAILDPWKATAFTAITGKMVYTKIHTHPTPKDEEAYDFLRGGCSGTFFLTENDISIVYNPGSCSNPDLVEVRKHIYLLRQAGTP